MRYLLALLLFAQPAFGQNWRLLELNTFSFEAAHLADNRDPYFPDIGSNNDYHESERWVGSLAANFDLNLASYKRNSLYWRNQIHGEGTNQQMRGVGWLYELGLSLPSQKMEVFHEHHSRHIMDADSPDGFPLWNRYGFRINFYTK